MEIIIFPTGRQSGSITKALWLLTICDIACQDQCALCTPSPTMGACGISLFPPHYDFCGKQRGRWWAGTESCPTHLSGKWKCGNEYLRSLEGHFRLMTNLLVDILLSLSPLVCLCMHLCAIVCVHVCVCVCVFMCVSVNVCAHVCMHVCVHVCVWTEVDIGYLPLSFSTLLF